jgi:hypothetical protein
MNGSEYIDTKGVSSIIFWKIIAAQCGVIAKQKRLGVTDKPVMPAQGQIPEVMMRIDYFEFFHGLYVLDH